ncbi:hypothetical protein [Nocardia cyriacigeorgica]|uniref:hypothetical protein n=1 Tax=Nocardia cyriacigeorgica TaxID=135487 RepID=UPI00245716E2|nr:hypothetical protein [Nocardia cyriacigeorgica]
MTATESHLLRPHAEQAFADELRALAAVDDRPRPPAGGAGAGGGVDDNESGAPGAAHR